MTETQQVAKRSSPFDVAERKGRDAFRLGLSESACPYHDRRTDRGAVTFSRAFIRAWFKGYRDERRKQTGGSK